MSYQVLDEHIEKRYYVKIKMNNKSEYRALTTVVYLKNDMTLDFYKRWEWYFKYREALFRIANPKAYIEYSTGNYDYELPSNVYENKIKGYLIAAKRKFTEFNRKLDKVKSNWSELFPIEEHPRYKATINKLEYYKDRVDEYQQKFDEINNKQNSL